MAWIDLIEVKNLFKGDVTPVTHGDKHYAVYDTMGGVTVSENRCTHAGAPLCHGYFDGHNIECPLHQGLFNASTGEALAAPVTRPLTMFPARINNGWVQVELPD